jgi:type III restriction enzyme
VLSLFFIDVGGQVPPVRRDGNPVKGDYARIFEEEYRRAAKLPATRACSARWIWPRKPPRRCTTATSPSTRRAGWTDTEPRQGTKANRDDAERAYNLIMKEKEKLLTFETPLKFIFSHSALRKAGTTPTSSRSARCARWAPSASAARPSAAGCACASTRTGERVRGFDVNTLTVIATESYEEFAENLQKEIEADTGIRFGIVEQHQFATIAVTGPTASRGPWAWTSPRPCGST